MYRRSYVRLSGESTLVPKKAQGRPAKGKARSKRPQQRPNRAPGPGTMAAVPDSAVAAAAATAQPTSRRTATRRAPTITINYAYLRGDIMRLAVLAPLMVVLLLIAYVIFHTA